MTFTEIYCFLCGLPCRSPTKCNLKYALEINDEISVNFPEEESLHLEGQKTDGSTLEDYTSGGPYWLDSYLSYFIKEYSPREYLFFCLRRTGFKFVNDNLKNLIKQTKWLSKCTFLTVTNDIIHKCRNLEKDSLFEESKKLYKHDSNFIFNKNTLTNNFTPGIVLHTECWNYIKKKFNISLKFSDLPVTENIEFKNFKTFNFINYNVELENYWSNNFIFESLCFIDSEYVSFYKNNVGSKSIIGNSFNSLQIKKNNLFPYSSSTFYKNGTFKIGDNKKLCIIKNKKWFVIPDTLKKIKLIGVKNKFNFLNGVAYIGGCSNKPIFIASITKNSTEYTIEILITDKMLKTLSL